MRLRKLSLPMQILAHSLLCLLIGYPAALFLFGIWNDHTNGFEDDRPASTPYIGKDIILKPGYEYSADYYNLWRTDLQLPRESFGGNHGAWANMMSSQSGWKKSPLNGENGRSDPISYLLLLLWGLPVLLVGLLVWWVSAAVRQERRNYDLILAVKRNEAAEVVTLLKQGADANARDTGRLPRSRLQIVTNSLHRLRRTHLEPDPVELPTALLVWLAREYAGVHSLGAPPKENSEIVQSLLAHGANVHITDAHGRSPLMIAEACGYTHTAQLLQARGAVPSAAEPQTDVEKMTMQ